MLPKLPTCQKSKALCRVWGEGQQGGKQSHYNLRKADTLSKPGPQLKIRLCGGAWAAWLRHRPSLSVQVMISGRWSPASGSGLHGESTWNSLSAILPTRVHSPKHINQSLYIFICETWVRLSSQMELHPCCSHVPPIYTVQGTKRTRHSASTCRTRTHTPTPTCMHTHTSTAMHTQTCPRAFTFTHTQSYAQTCPHAHTNMPTCIHVHTCTQLCTNMPTCMHIHTHSYAHTNTPICVHIHTRTQLRTNTPKCVYIHTCTQLCTHKHAHVHAHSHTHTAMHKYAHVHAHSHMHSYAHTPMPTGIHIHTHTQLCTNMPIPEHKLHSRSTYRYTYTHAHTGLHVIMLQGERATKKADTNSHGKLKGDSFHGKTGHLDALICP